MQRSIVTAAFPLIATFATALAASQPAPTRSHPRIWLDAETITGLEAQSSGTGSAVARGATRCRAARTNPSSYSSGGWQGFEFVTTLSGCLISWVGSKNADDLATAVKYWTVLLDDYQDVGDGLGGDTVVTHDTGYAMRTFAPYSALAYDWLHDAPGVTEALRARARSRFDAWSSYYSTSGYLKDMPGANYQAGYLFAATLIAIAEAGEAGAAGDAHWATVRDRIWGGVMADALAPGAVLDGGDWPEGWQYGPLSVLEYSLAGRAMQENGATIAGLDAWASSLVTRFAHGLTPAAKMYPAGDTDDETANRDPVNGALLAAIAGPANETARAWARHLDASLGLDEENPLFDALAAARTGPSEPAANVPTGYLAEGTGNFYARGDWTSETAWSVFQCTRRLVDDHQHNDAGNFVMSRGADDIVVDPSPYGTLSTLTGNAPAIDSAVLPSGYSPSQGNWGESTRLAWAKATSSGIAAARCDYADQFRRSDVPSDVEHALRDFVFVPNGASGTVVLVDRAVTGSATRGLHLRLRTPATLALGGNVATGSAGATSLVIDRVFATSGTPSVRTMPKASECSSSNHTCDVSRLSGMEYRTDVSGPAGLALHVVGATAQGGSAPSRAMLAGDGYRGVLLGDDERAVAVVTNDSPDGALGGSLVYRVPTGTGAVHVVVDAPVDANGRSDVSARRDGSDCAVTVTPHAGSQGGFDGRPLVVHVSDSCAPTEDASQPVDPGGSDDGSGGTAGSTGSGGDTGGAGSVDGRGGEGSSAEGGSDAGRAGASPTTGGASAASGAVGDDAGVEPSAPVVTSCAFGRSHERATPWLLAFAAALGAFVRSRRRRLG